MIEFLCFVFIRVVLYFLSFAPSELTLVRKSCFASCHFLYFAFIKRDDREKTSLNPGIKACCAEQ